MFFISFTTKRTFFSYIRSLFIKRNDIEKVYQRRDIHHLKELLDNSNHWDFLSQKANGMSLVHDAVERNDIEILELFANLPYKDEIMNNLRHHDVLAPIHLAIK